MADLNFHRISAPITTAAATEPTLVRLVQNLKSKASSAFTGITINPLAAC